MAQLIIVSNRVAVPNGKDAPQAGGLATVVKAALKLHPGLWFGWTGRVADPAHLETRKLVHRGITYVVTDLADEDYQEYYNGFANRVLWPILHYRLDLAEFSRRDLSGYLRVNELFARKLDKIVRPDDWIWIHDYHLIPLAQFLRERGHKNRIGFFAHTPFPPPEIMTALPNHERLIPALRHYDLVGFQTGGDAFNFTRYLTRECGMHSLDFNFPIEDRVMRVDAFPVSIATAEFAKLARRAEKSSFVRQVLASLIGRAMIIGVDRLDYSKGIIQRMEAFERFLAANQAMRNRVSYLQITPKSRIDIREYAEMNRQVGELVGRINGAYGEANWTPIRYVNRPYSRTALAGLFRAARAALVTPFYDGMNLVAKEFVAAQNPDDPGVLILSRFAGAAHELERALLVNPFDPDAVSGAIARALHMPLSERKERYQAMFEVISRNDVSNWARRYIDALQDLTSVTHWAERHFPLPRGNSANDRAPLADDGPGAICEFARA